MATVVNRILQRLGRLPAHQLDAGFDEALRALGEVLSVNRSYVFVISGDHTSNTHEWCADGTSPQIDVLQQLPLDTIEAWLPSLRAGEHVQIDDVAALPECRRGERELLEEQDIASLLVVPMVSFGELVGFVGFDSTAHRVFSVEERGLLRTVGEMLSATWLRREAGSVVMRAKSRLEELLRHVDDMLLLVDGQGTCSWASQSVTNLGLGPEQLIGFAPQHLLVDTSLQRLNEHVADWETGPDAELEIDQLQLVTPLGIRWITMRIRDLRDHPDVGGLLVVLRDVTDEQHRLASSRRHALTDTLTGLPNRASLHQLLEHELETDAALAVMFADLDRFKLVNDTHGHTIGDELLRQVASRLSRIARPGEATARWGGDEFVVLIRPGEDGSVDAAAARFARALRTPFFLAGEVHNASASFGLRIRADGEMTTPDVLLRDADTALGVAKDRGRDQVVVYDERMGERTIRRGSLLWRLQTATTEDLIRPAYQRIVDLDTGRTVGVEALARWHDPVLGHVSPAEFIPIAEETGLIVPIGMAILRHTLQDFVDWPRPITVSVNLSTRQLEQPDLVESIIQQLRRVGFPASRLRLEVTESLWVSDQTRARKVLARMRDAGMTIALDDFGTGYSSLAVLRGLPLDVLKIDQAFISTIDRDPVVRNLVQSIVEIAQHLGLSTVAEGVETEAQAAVLREAGCTTAQGWLHGRPADAATLAAEEAAVGAHAGGFLRRD